jgi:tetratricopeptide (TPR) repeat protein/energy-coupling factor transporter ATP-binding protein EcfA2
LDKYEYKLKLDEIKNLMAKKQYTEAAEIADSINWRKVRNVNALMKAGDIYAQIGRYDEAKEILLMAYDRSPIGRMIIYKLAEIAIKTKEFDEAQEYYDEFVEIAPHDNLKYILRYEMNKAKGAGLDVLIQILEELKEQEYTEKWAFELAYLYHQAGRSEECINACDELILWFGDGPYVEKALELKMLYQPLNRAQEDKYRQFKQRKDGIVEVRPEDYLESGEIIKEPVQIKPVTTNAEKFNTVNLQEELARSMQQIMNATEKEEVADTMQGIKKIVEEIPYLQLPQDEEAQKERFADIPTDEEIDGSLKINFQEMLGEDYDGQMRMVVPEKSALEAQITGQMSIQDILEEWEKTKRAAEKALQEAEQQKLESAKAKALAEAGDIMERLADVIPQLDAGLTSKELLEKEYLGKLPEEEAGQLVANMNDILQQQIDSISQANAKIDEFLAAGVPGQSGEAAAGAADAMEIPEEEGIAAADEEEPAGTEEMTELSPEEELPEIALPDDIAEEVAATEAEEVSDAAEEVLPNIQLEPEAETEDAKPEEKLPEIAEPNLDEDNIGERKPITHLSKEQKAIFTYFVPVSGMEPQICQAMEGSIEHLEKGIKGGNILIQGARGSGKTVLATALVKAIQNEIGKPGKRVGKIDAVSLNQKNIPELLKKVAGGCLIIEKIGGINRETAVKLSLALEADDTGILVIAEDTREGITKAMGRDESFAKRFTEKITLPIFTSDELVSFAKSYAHELTYEIDEMAVLALYNRISNIQRLDRATTLTEVKEIVDEAIANSEKFSIKKVFFSKKYKDDDYVILHEKDFEE